jgi:WD40 repeat protein
MAKRASEPAATAPARPDAFLSYSRRDRQYVEARLATALEAAGKDVWIDLDDIRGGASDWRATVWAGIEASKAVVFVLSPDSLASRVCGEELAHATALNKRVIPLLHRPLDGVGVPEALERPNWIFGRDSDDFDVTVTTLVTALETDEPWLEMHARLTTRTAEWLRMERDGSYLLRGRDLRAAERWLDEKGEHAESPTNDQIAYINAGRRASQRRQAMLLGGVLVALGVSIVLGVVAYVQRQTARSQSFAAQAIEAAKRDPERALHLALDAAGLRKGPLVTRALRTSLVASGWTHILRDDKARPVNDVAFSPDGRRAATAGDDGSASVWDVARGHKTASLVGHRAAINSVAFSPDGRRIATAASDGTARVWDLAGHQLRVLSAAKAGEDVWSVAFDAQGRRLITGGAKGAATVWDLAGHRPRIPLVGAGEDRLVTTQFSRDGRHALTAGRAGEVWVWRIAAHPRRQQVLRPDTTAPRLAVALFSPDGRRVLAGYGSHPIPGEPDQPGAVCVWTLRAHHGASCHAQAGSITDAAFSPDGRRTVSASDSGTVVIRDAGSGRALVNLPRAGPINAVSFSSDGQHIVTAGDDRDARIWSRDGRLEHVLSGHTDAVNAATFSQDGDLVLTGSTDGSARVWPAGQGETALPGSLSGANFAFSPDGRRLLAVDPQGRALVWDLGRRGDPVAWRGKMGVSPGIVPPCDEPAGCSPWSRDSRYIAGVTGGDFQPTVWDVSRGVARRLGPAAFGAAFMPDMRVLLLDNGAGATIVDPTSASACAGGPIESLPAGGRPRAKRCAKLRTGAPVGSVDFTAAGRTLTLSNGRIALWGRDGQCIVIRCVHSSSPGGVEAAAVTADGRLLAVSAIDRVELYDVRAGRWHDASQAPHHVSRLVFDRAGNRLLAVGDDRAVRVWDVAHLGHRPEVLRHTSRVLDAEFSPDQGLVLTASADGMARLWDPTQEATLLELRTSPQGGARFSNDGRAIALGGQDGVRLRACEICAPFGRLVALARARLPDG